MTPLQMALVAAAVANGGTVMEPHLVKQVTRRPAAPIVAGCSRTCWRQRDEAGRPPPRCNMMMQAVVAGGTGTAAQIPGVKVAGKTGTAETGRADVYDAWFIFFAPADNPEVAGAVVVEHQLNGFGGVDRRADRQAADAGDPARQRRTIDRHRYGHVRHPDRPHLRPPLRDQAQARLGRDGRRLPRRGPGARPAASR